MYRFAERSSSISNIRQFIDSKGNLLPGASLDLFNTYMEYNVVKNFKNDPDYGEYKFDSSRSFSSVFSNLKKLTKDC